MIITILTTDCIRVLIIALITGGLEDRSIRPENMRRRRWRWWRRKRRI